MTSAPRPLEVRVAAVRRALVLRLAGAAVAWLGAAAGAVLVLAWAGAGADGWGQGSAVPLLLDLALVAGVWGAAQAVRAGTRRWLAEARVAEAMEGAVGAPPGMVRGALELGRQRLPGVSRALAEKAQADAARILEGTDGDLGGALARRVGAWGRRGAVGACVSFAAVAVLAAVSPPRAWAAWAGLLRPLDGMAAPGRLPLRVDPGSVEVPRGSSVEIRVEAPGRSVAVLEWQAAGDVLVRDTLALEGGVGTHTFASVSVPLVYRVRTADGAATSRYRLDPADAAFLTRLTVEVLPPPHAGIPPAVHRDQVPPLVVPEGTRITVVGTTTRALAEAALVHEGEDVVDFTVGEEGFAGAWRPTRSGVFSWRLMEAGGGGVEGVPGSLAIVVVADSAPVVAVSLPGTDTVLPLSMTQPLVVEARDDHGLRFLELVARRVTAAGAAGDPLVQRVDLGGERAVVVRPLLDLASWGLLPGDEVRYFARVRDDAPEPRWGRTREYALRVPRVGEVRREAGARLGDVARRLETLAAEADRQARATRDLERQLQGDAARRGARAAATGSAGEDAQGRREEALQAMARQEALAERLAALRGEMEDLVRAMEEAGAADPALTRDMEELFRLLDAMGGEGLEASLEELGRALRRDDGLGARRSLADLAAEQDALRARMEAALDRFRRAAVDQEFRAARGDAEALARAQRALAGELRGGERPELRARQQAGLAEGAEALDERLRRLEEGLEHLRESRAARDVAGAREEARRGGEEMARAAGEAGREQGAAATAADEAAVRMDEAARRLAGAQEEMARERGRAAHMALQRAADEALALARRQADLGRALASGPPHVAVALRGDVTAVAQGVRNLLQALHAATGGAVPQGPRIAEEAGHALEALERTVQALEGRRIGTPPPDAVVSQAVSALNRLALAALAGSDAASGSEGGEGSGEEVREGVEQAAQRQGDLVNQAGELAPLQLGPDALGEELRRLAEEQEAVARTLEELSSDAGARERTLGDLDQLAAEAQALAEALASGRLAPETVQRQERLFHRLLDAGRGLRNEASDPSSERESRSPAAVRRGPVTPLREDQLGGVRYRLPTPEEMQGLPPGLRDMVIRYFERLNRAGGG